MVFAALAETSVSPRSEKPIVTDGLSLIRVWAWREDPPPSSWEPEGKARRRRRGGRSFRLVRLVPHVKFIHDSEQRDTLMSLLCPFRGSGL